jgi:hypothetical protein
MAVLDDQSSSPSPSSSGSRPFSPKAFLRSRRPERFSDSSFTEKRTLDRQLLEYQLESLTSRGQETNFERFARRLAEREVCPNILPQTGPTGGGDSKVDAETYPVAEGLALSWFVGEGTRAARERWAFAFSAKQAWRGKVKSDIAKIAATGRGYTKAFFVTNQFVPDRKRAEVEDHLSKTHGLDVRILDRTWILERVFSGGHEDLVEEELGLRAQEARVKRKGPLDSEREIELEETDARIEAAIREARFTSALVDDALYTAELARALERPRQEVDGRFARAERLALAHGTQRQRVEVAYQEAWTAFWWYEDEAPIPALYEKVEERARGSRNAYDLERLVNLWHLLFGSVYREQNPSKTSWHRDRTETLRAELERLVEEKTRPSTALQAETFLLQIQLTQRAASEEPLGPILKKLQEVMGRAAGLTGFPMDTVVQIITELGKFLGDEPEYEELFETTVRVSSEQEQGLTAARLLVVRGQQHLDANRPYDAIRVLGRSLSRLFHHKGRYEAVRALYLCGLAYERVGLLWAARGTLVAAASLATDEFWRYGEVNRFQAACYDKLKWIELQLGRLPHVLAWHANDFAIRSALVAHGDDPSRLFDNEEIFDASLGVLLLRTDLFGLRALARLPDALERHGLPCASMALIYALGHDEEVWDRLGYDPDEREKFFVDLSCQPVADDLPVEPDLWNRQRITLRSRVLGCEYIVKAENSPPCVEIAESILAALEAFLASVSIDNGFASLPELTIEVRKSDFVERPFSFEVTERAGRPHIEVRTRPFDPHQLTVDEQQTVRSAILRLVTALMAHSVMFKDIKETLSQLVEGEEAWDRALAFTGSFVAVGNVLGNDPPLSLIAWENGRSYPLRRTKPWNGEIAKPHRPLRKPTIGKGEPPPDVMDVEKVKHSEIRSVSLIRDGLWDKAGWSGIGFIHDQFGERPPIMAPMFRDQKAGIEIFRHWLDELGRFDETYKLRVVIVRGIDRNHPHAYRVLFGTNLDNAFAGEGVRFASIGIRLHRMDPSSSFNLDRFVADFDRRGAYILAPGFTDDGETIKGVGVHVGLRMQSLFVRGAWEIGRHDLDSVAILPTEVPIIPDGIADPPIHELLTSRQGNNEAASRPQSKRQGQGSQRNLPCPCGSEKKFKHCHGKSL